MYGKPPPDDALSRTFANVLRLAMQEGLGRPMHEVNRKWNPDSLATAVSGGFSPEAVRKWMSGNVIPLEQNVKQIIDVLTAGEPHARAWFDCLSHISSQERQISRKPRVETTRASTRSSEPSKPINSPSSGVWIAEAERPRKDISANSKRQEKRFSTSHKPILVLLGASRWNSEHLIDRPSCATTRMAVYHHFLGCGEVLSNDVVDFFDWPEAGDYLLNVLTADLRTAFSSGHQRDLWLFIFGHGKKDSPSEDLIFPLAASLPTIDDLTSSFRFSQIFAIVSKMTTGNIYVVIDASSSYQAIEYLKHVRHHRLMSEPRGVVLLCSAGLTEFSSAEATLYRLNLFGKLMRRSTSRLTSNSGSSRITLNRFIKEMHDQAALFAGESTSNSSIYRSFELAGGLQHFPMHGKIMNTPVFPLRREPEKHYSSGVFGYKYLQ